MALADVTDWMDEYGRPGVIWYAKRLSANDTLATNAHQAGPYFPKDLLFRIFPALNRPEAENPDIRFDLYIDSHPDHRKVRAVWYNNAFRGGTRNETRLTGFGGASSALLDPDSTGSLAIFAFVSNADSETMECHVWVCGGEGTEADLFEERLGPVEPKQFVVWTPGELAPRFDLFATMVATPTTCHLQTSEIPVQWFKKFPSGEEIIRRTIAKRPPVGMNPDVRILRRRQCEYEMFLSIEQAVFLPRITSGFTSVDGFLSLAQTILQSRKSRSGNSLELHVREIMSEEGLVSGISFTHRPVVEGGKRPDFLFPSQADYDNFEFPASKLRMLAAKTTCKDRWRQVINEADRIRIKHLLTLQEGVSEGQFREMTDAGVRLVVPAGLHRAFPNSVRPHLITFESFIGEIRMLASPHQ
ncbi:type II restriction endonuclease [Methylocella silvestris]|uniref:Type II restriction endonuclease n=1 Tax=Methylocella silvestris TaxID=199596 RepID=A0A2J7TLK3_METSI|nr:type II restriction endonuclease [Methylocella silvestris]PNG27655.1 type II restriction endonuclease [Methylocella silvestris]